MTTKLIRKRISVLAFVMACVVPTMSQIFKSPVVYPSGAATAQSVAVADVNKDGKLDLVVANYGSNAGSVGVLLGNGDGTFQAATIYNVVLGADTVAVEDLDGDGWPDLVVGSSDGGPSSRPWISVLLNNGDGTFQSAVGYLTGGFDVRSVAVADVNGDGRPDLVAVNGCASNTCGQSSVAILLGNGDGTFGSAMTYQLPGITGAFSVAVADLNKDGKPDLLVANTSETGDGVIDVLLNNGDGTFSPSVAYESGGSEASCVIVGDVNGDGKLDAIVANRYESGNNNYGSVGVLLGNGDGTFGVAVTYRVGLLPTSVAIGDVNGDHVPDLVTTNGVPQGVLGVVSASAGVLLNNGDGTFKTPVISYSAGGRNGYSVALADLNHDGKPDVVVAEGCDGYNSSCPRGGGVAVLLGLPATTKTTVTTSGSPSSHGQAVTFTATIIAAYGPIPDGTIVKFSNNGTQIGRGTTVKGKAKFTTSSLTVGTHMIKANYPSSAYFKASAGTVSQTVR